MSYKYVILAYFIVPLCLAMLTYAVLLDLVGKPMSIVAGACIAALFDFAFLNSIGKPIRWK